MPSTSFNFFAIILCFLLLGLPIILISMSTAPPPPDRFTSEIDFFYPDQTAFVYLNETAKINGSNSYWDSIRTQAPLSRIYNLTEFIKSEEEFLRTYNYSEYTGFSKKVHVFDLNMSIYDVSALSENMTTIYRNQLSTRNSTFYFYLTPLDEYNAYYRGTGNYPSETDAISTIISTHTDLKYLVLVSFHGDFDFNGEWIKATFERFLLLTENGEVLLFITNE